MIDLFYLHLKEYASNCKWCLVFQVFEDFPPFVAEIANDTSFRLLYLGDRKSPATLVPSDDRSDEFGYYVFNSSARSTMALIHFN